MQFCVFPLVNTSKGYWKSLKGLVSSRVFHKWKRQPFLQSKTSQTWRDRGALLSLCCQITPSCRLVKFPFQSIVSTQPGATAPSVVPGCNPQPPSIELGYTRAGISTRPRSKGRVLTRSSWFERFWRDGMLETSNEMYPVRCIRAIYTMLLLNHVETAQANRGLWLEGEFTAGSVISWPDIERPGHLTRRWGGRGGFSLAICMMLLAHTIS